MYLYKEYWKAFNFGFILFGYLVLFGSVLFVYLALFHSVIWYLYIKKREKKPNPFSFKGLGFF